MIPGELTPNFGSSWPAMHRALNSHWRQEQILLPVNLIQSNNEKKKKKDELHS